jgi:ankyrin repeat protein
MKNLYIIYMFLFLLTFPLPINLKMGFTVKLLKKSTRYSKLIYIIIIISLLSILCISGCHNGKSEMELIEACKVGDINKVNESLAKGVKVDSKDKAGNTPLIVAVQMNQIKIVEILLDAGSDSKIINKKGKSAIMIALEHSNSEIELLIQSHQERLAFEKVTNNKTIKSFSSFIREYPSSILVDDAVSEIYSILISRFPVDQYKSKQNRISHMDMDGYYEDYISKDLIKKKLLQAFEDNRSLLIIFIPLEINKTHSTTWKCETPLFEIAGIPVKIEKYTYWVSTWKASWSLDGWANLRKPVLVEPFNQALCSWTMDDHGRGWTGESLGFSYKGEDSNGNRISVTSSTLLGAKKN